MAYPLSEAHAGPLKRPCVAQSQIPKVNLVAQPSRSWMVRSHASPASPTTPAIPPPQPGSLPKTMQEVGFRCDNSR
jgi:hypothetical protein